MKEYQNIFTAIQVQGQPEMGIPLPRGDDPRIGKGFLSYWAGKIGNAQIGPIYLGTLGVISLISFLLAFNIIGLNFWAQVGWDPVQFVRQLFWLSLDPPAPSYGLTVLPPLQEGGWFMIVGFFLTVSVLTWWLRTYRRAKALGLGMHVPIAFASSSNLSSVVFATAESGEFVSTFTAAAIAVRMLSIVLAPVVVIG